MNSEKLTAVSLFSSGGIGDLALRSLGIEVLVANELLEDRSKIFSYNFPSCQVICGDIREKKSEIIEKSISLLDGKPLDILFATPPCQGMSKNGRGKLLKGIRLGVKPILDERNQLIIHAVEIAKALQPRLVVFENVPEMKSTIIQAPSGEYLNILDYVTQRLSPVYEGSYSVIEFANYGVPQRRQRLLAVYSKDASIKLMIKKGDGEWLPPITHAKDPVLVQERWISVEDAISHLPKLDAGNSQSATSTIPFHSVPLLDKDKYFWVSNTPIGKGAFDNQCVNPLCLCQENPVHGSVVLDGINSSRKTTPVRCIKCNQLLPRPWVNKDGEYKIMSGFTSAYKRMKGNLPASALTRNLSYACSDQKLHPTQHRVLSLYEAFIIHTISDYEYNWERSDGKKVSHKTVREIIGESIPPKGLEISLGKLVAALKERKDMLGDVVADKAA